MLFVIARRIWPQCFDDEQDDDEDLIYNEVEQCRHSSVSYCDVEVKTEPVEGPSREDEDTNIIPKFDFTLTVPNHAPQNSIAHQLYKQHELQLEYNKRLTAFLLQIQQQE